MIEKSSNKMLDPKNQLNLYGYKTYFNNFVKLYDNNKMPNSLLISGLKGSGKATFAYHFINYMLSVNENYSYESKNLRINDNNRSFQLLKNNTQL